MDKNKLAYLKSLRPGPHRNGNEILKDGIKLGKTIKAGKSRFARESGYSSYLDYKKDCMKKGKITWNILMGLASLEEQVEATRELFEFTRRLGFSVDSLQPIPSGLVALPKEYRENAPSTTSFVTETFDDYKAQVEAAPIEVTFNDYHLASPNCLETTIWAIEAGASLIGEFSQIVWGYPGFTDELKRFSDMVTCLGILASKRDDMFAVKTYLDDGLPGYFIDTVSYVGYTLIEHYICTRLCNVRYMVAYGGLLTEGDTRMAIAMAIDKLLSTEDQPALHYINSSTNSQWDHDIHANYGASVQEYLFEILVERKYNMGLGINPVAITEKLRVPTLDELQNIFLAGKRAEEYAHQWDKFMDFSYLEKMRDILVEQGKVFFDNFLAGCTDAEVDVKDPLDLILFIRNFNPLKFEQMFHPSTFDEDTEDIQPFQPTILGRQTVDMRDEIVADLLKAGYEGSLKGKKIIIASADAHTYGLLLVEGVLTSMGAEVVNGGVDMDASDLLDLADEEGTLFAGISCHNGQALDYGRQLAELRKERGRDYTIFMGGKMNAILPGHSEPTDIEDMLHDLGIFAENNMNKTIPYLGAR